MVKKSVYIKLMKELGYITTDKLTNSDAEIWDIEFSDRLLFKKKETKSKKKKL